MNILLSENEMLTETKAGFVKDIDTSGYIVV